MLYPYPFFTKTAHSGDPGLVRAKSTMAAVVEDGEESGGEKVMKNCWNPSCVLCSTWALSIIRMICISLFLFESLAISILLGFSHYQVAKFQTN